MMNPVEKTATYPRAVPVFKPVPRNARKADGWTVERQQAFIAALAETGSVRRAAEAAGMSYSSAYQLRKARGATSFIKAWDAAISTGVSHIYDTLLDHSLNGVPEPVFYAGKEVGERRRFNHKTMTWMIDNRRQGWHAKGAGGRATRWTRTNCAATSRNGSTGCMTNCCARHGCSARTLPPIR
jgi:hypothetical protein